MQSDQSTLNSPIKIIIKKENIGLSEHQHQKYQYHLFNNNEKRDKIYEDLTKVKDRLEKAPPNMQQVIQIDMKRARTNKFYERKLSHDLTGPRGLNWQFKNRLQRLQSVEREAERDLIRLNHDLVRANLTSLSNQQLTPRPSTHFSRSPTRLSIPIGPNLIIQRLSQTTPILLDRPMTVGSSQRSINRMTPLDYKRFSLSKANLVDRRTSFIPKQIQLKFNGDRSDLQPHADTIDQQKREIEQKLKEFLH